MSLQVWMPLKGNLDNHGLANVTVTNNGATYSSTGGKFGGCYNFDGSGQWIRISLPSTMTTVLNTTVCAWVKSTASPLALGGISHDTSNTTIGSCTLYSSGWQFSNNGSWGYVSGGTVVNTGVWHHVACTVGSDTITTYLDGVKVATATIADKCAMTELNSNNFIEIGCDHPGGNEYLTGSVNDFRVYDNCLTDFDIKRVYQEFDNSSGSLQVWLPLTKDLRNQGLKQLPASSYTTMTQNNNGKLGKCYAGNLIYHITDEWLGNKWTLACWAKSTSWGQYNDILLCKNLNSSDASQFYLSVVGGNVFNIGVNGGSATSQYSYTFATNTWYHLCVSYDGSTIKQYINGSLVKTLSYSSDQKTGMTNLGINCRSTNDAGTSYTGGGSNYLNDIRIYDYALSSKEVHEISKGLILHYPLDDGGFGNANYVLGTMEPSSTNGKIYSFSSVIPSGTQVTISCWIDADNIIMSGSKRIGLSSSMSKSDGSGTYWFEAWISYGNGLISDNESFHGYISYTTTIPGNMSNIGTYIQTLSSGTVCISKVKVEVGDKRTNWVPNSSDALYTSLGIGNEMIYDCSGYGNHGQIYKYDANGSITIDSDTKRYSSCTHIKAGNPTESNTTGLCYIYGNCVLTTPSQLTISFWCKPITNYQSSTSRQGVFCTTSNNIGTNTGTDYNTTAMHHRDSSIDMCQNNGTSKNLGTPFVFSEWHYYTFIYDGQNMKWYKDGVYQAMNSFTDTDSLKSFSAVVIGFTKAGGVYRKNDCYMSDFRVYTTALSADDILDLYNVGMYVDKFQNIHTYNLQEIDTVTIEKSGIVNAKDEFAEYDDIGFYKSGLITANQFYEY